MSQINTEVKPFKATAYHNGKFVEVTEASLKGKWSIFFFYPADFTFVCPTELGDLADNYAEFQKMGVEIYGNRTMMLLYKIDPSRVAAAVTPIPLEQMVKLFNSADRIIVY